MNHKSQADTSLIQTSIFEAFKNLKDLSKKQVRMKLCKKNRSSSPIVISDESESENEVKKPCISKSVKRELPEGFDVSNDGCFPKSSCSSEIKFKEMMVVNKPNACSTPLGPLLTSPVHEETIDYDSDATVILESSPKERIVIEHNISIIPESTSRTFTSSKIPNISGASTSEEAIERVGSKKQNLVDIFQQVFRSSSTTHSSQNNFPVEEKPRHSSPELKTIETKKNNSTQQECIVGLNDSAPKSVSTELSVSSSKKSSNSRNQSTSKRGSDNTKIAAKNPNPQKILLNKLKSSSSEPLMNCISDKKNQVMVETGSSDDAKITISTTPQKIHSCEVNVTSQNKSNSAATLSKSKKDQNQCTSEFHLSRNAETRAQDASTLNSDWIQLEMAPTVSSINRSSHKKRSDTDIQSTSKSDGSGIAKGGANGASSPNVCDSGVNQFASKVSGSDNAQTDKRNNGGQKVKNNNVNISSSSSIPQIPTRCKPSKSHASTHCKEKSSKYRRISKSISSEHDKSSPAVRLKEVNSSTSSIIVIPRPPEKHTLNDSCTSSPSKRAINSHEIHMKERKNNDAQKIILNNANSLSTSSVPQTSKCKPSKLPDSDPGKEKCDENRYIPKSVGLEQNGSAVHPKEVNSSTSSIIVISRSPTTHKLSDFPTSSSSTRAINSPEICMKEKENNDAQKVISNNGNTSSSSSVPQTSKFKPSKPPVSNPGKGKCGEIQCIPKSVDSEQNGISSPAVCLKEVNSSTSSVIPRSPTKRKLSDSPTSSPKKRAIKTPSPKKERGMNINYLTVFKELFSSVSESRCLKHLIEGEIAELNRIILFSDQKYFYVILKLFSWLPKPRNIFRFCEDIFGGLEDKEVVKIYTFLQEKNIIDVDFGKEDLSILLDHLDLTAVKNICEKFKLKRTLTNKKEMIIALLKYSNTQSTLTFSKTVKDLIRDEVLLKMGKCVMLKNCIREAFYKAFLLGTFTNPLFTNIQDFFRSVLTRTVYPEYRIEEYDVFHSREEFTRYATARRFRDALDEAFRKRNHLEIFQISKTAYINMREIGNNNTHERYLTVPHLKRFTAQSRYISILSKACEILKSKYPVEVKTWLQYLIKTFPSSHLVGEWYFQLTWLYMRHLEPIDYEQSAKLLIKILQNKRDCLSEVQLQKLGDRGELLKRGQKYKIDQLYHDTIAILVPEPIKLEHFPQRTVDARAIRSDKPGKKRKYIVNDSEGDKNYFSVERIAMDDYINRCGYTDGCHCEGSLIRASFTLFFWDLIYNPEILVPATFLSKYQEVPLDMMTTYFYTNRKDAIDKRLRDISSEWSDSKTIEFLKKSYDMHSHERGFCEPGLIIKDTKMLEILVDCIGRKILAKIYERLVKNIAQHSSGMPDLFLWNIEEKKSKFVEVKGENDKLSVQQRLWLKYLESIGAHIEVCIVHSMGSKRKQKVKCVSAIEEGKVRKVMEQTSPSISSTPKINNRKPKLNKDATPMKKHRKNEENERDTVSAIEKGRVKELTSPSTSLNSCKTPKVKNRKSKLNNDATPVKKRKNNEKNERDIKASTSTNIVQEDNDSRSEFV